MRFRDRADAGRQLAERLMNFSGRNDTIVLGVPRGGVPVALEVANALGAPLDVLLSRKLGVPGQEELPFGALALGGGIYLDHEIIRAEGITEDQIADLTEQTRRLLDDRAVQYRIGRPPLQLESKVVILVDDGVATGASMIAAIHAVRQMKPKQLIVAVPVAPLSTCLALERLADMLIVVQTPEDFYAVGQFYERFAPTSDEEVIAALHHARPSSHETERPVEIPLNGFSLPGLLCSPPGAKTIVVFVHGSGSSRLSPRNQRVAQYLNHHGMATLLFDLLTSEEEELDRHTAELRFDIDLLTDRLLHVVRWVRKQPLTARFSIALFGASTGAAAALRVAALAPDAISSVVSRGGRPDLAGAGLAGVKAPTLLIVGSLDETVLALNRQALSVLKCPKELALVPGATHLFEEHGALDQVEALATAWIRQHSRQDHTHPNRLIA